MSEDKGSDDGLDDFFAKKDKSKKKSKASKTISSDILDKQQENPKKKKKKKKEKDKPQQSSSADSEGNKQKEDDEWNEYEAETEKDYTGLRIQNLQIKEEEENKDTGDDNDDEDGENGERRDGAQGPWNKNKPQGAAPVIQHIPEPAPQPEPEKPKEEAKPVGKYVPPSRRGMSDTTSSASMAQKRRSKKTAPNIQSEEDFPTLGGAMPECEQTDLSSFERVRSGKRQDENPTGQPARLEIGNKFDALSRGDGM